MIFHSIHQGTNMKHRRCCFKKLLSDLFLLLFFWGAQLSPAVWAAAETVPAGDPQGVSSLILIAVLGAITILSLVAAGICLILLSRLRARSQRSDATTGLAKKPYRFRAWDSPANAVSRFFSVALPFSSAMIRSL